MQELIGIGKQMGNPFPDGWEDIITLDTTVLVGTQWSKLGNTLKLIGHLFSVKNICLHDNQINNLTCIIICRTYSGEQ